MNKIFILSLFICFTSFVHAQVDIKPDAWYILQNGHNDVSMANGAKMNTGAAMVAKKQVLTGGHWKFIANDSGLYKIQNRVSKMYLASYGKTTKGSVVRQTNTPGFGALWRIIQLQGGKIMIQNKVSFLFIGIASENNKTPLIQAKALSARITWTPEEVIVTKGLPKNTNGSAFVPKNGGKLARAYVRNTGEITIEGVKPRNGQRIYFFHQQLAAANEEGLSFNPKKPPICGKTYLIRKVLPKIILNMPMPNMYNRRRHTFMFVVEVY